MSLKEKKVSEVTGKFELLGFEEILGFLLRY